MAAEQNDLSPSIEAHRRLMARWVLLDHVIEISAARPHLYGPPPGIFFTE
jgi:hypothetical protein